MTEENIIHFGAVKLRVNGVGNLKLSLFTLDRKRSTVMVPLKMEQSTEREPTRLCNFVTQRAVLRVETTEINEVMRINRIILYTKPIYTQFPG